MILHPNQRPGENRQHVYENNRPRRLHSPEAAAAAAARQKPVLPDTGLRAVLPNTGLRPGAVYNNQYIVPAAAASGQKNRNPQPAPAPARVAMNGQKKRHPQPAPAAAPARVAMNGQKMRHPQPAPAAAPALAAMNGQKNRHAHQPDVHNREAYRYGNVMPVPPRRPISPNQKPNPHNDRALYGNDRLARLFAHMWEQDDRIGKPHDPLNDYDIRFIILRHGERLDHAVGRDWFTKIFVDPDAPPEAYQNPNLPKRLPYRYPSLIYEYDPPISANGQQKAMEQGLALRRRGIKIDHCFSSPASRCVLTADAVLHGMNQRKVPISIDQHLFESMNWNAPLAQLRNMEPFLTPKEWKVAGFNINTSFPTEATYLRPYGTENDYVDRSRYFFDETVRQYDLGTHAMQQKKVKQITILVIGHATTAKILEHIALRRKFDPANLLEESKDVPYLYTAGILRNPKTKEWIAKGIPV